MWQRKYNFFQFIVVEILGFQEILDFYQTLNGHYTSFTGGLSHRVYSFNYYFRYTNVKTMVQVTLRAISDPTFTNIFRAVRTYLRSERVVWLGKFQSLLMHLK